MNRRSFLQSTALASLLPLWPRLQEAPLRLAVDADTANEIDDLYAITRAILEPGFDVIGLSSAQWFHHLAPSDSVYASQRLNEDLVDLLGRQDIPVPLGAEVPIGKPWGGDEPQPSAAQRFIEYAARQTPPGQKLTVATLGAATNLASAVKMAPEIVPKLSCYLLGTRYDAERGVWSKHDFNVRRDLNALNLLLDTEGLELHIMPVNILLDFRFNRDDTLGRLQGRGGVWDYLAARWLTHYATADTWIMWDLALIEALARPSLAEERTVMTPPENVQREVQVYTAIDAEAMQESWWRLVEEAQG